MESKWNWWVLLWLQASLSRAFGRKLKQERPNNPPPTLSLSKTTDDDDHDHDALLSIDGEASNSIYSEARNWTLKRSQGDKHRRVKSSSDIDSITITRVWFYLHSFLSTRIIPIVFNVKCIFASIYLRLLCYSWRKVTFFNHFSFSLLSFCSDSSNFIKLKVANC